MDRKDYKFCPDRTILFKISNIYGFWIYCWKMREMFVFEKIDCSKQNLRAMSNDEGIFILDRRGQIIFANEKAKEIYKLRRELKKTLSQNKTKLRKGCKEIVLYPIFDENKLKFFFGVIRDMEEIIKIKKILDITYERVKAFREDIAHHFFNPIAIAKGYLNLLSEKNLDPEDKVKVEKVKTALERVEAVVKNIVINGKICE